MRSVVGKVSPDTFSCLYTFPAGFVVEVDYPAFGEIRDGMSAPNSNGRGRVLLNQPSQRYPGYRDLIIIQRMMDPKLFREFFPSVAPGDQAFYGFGASSLRRRGRDSMIVDYDAFLREVRL